MVRESTQQLIRDSLAGLKQPVRVILFTTELHCEQCPDAVHTAKAIKAASPKISLELFDLIMDRDKTEEFGVKRAPTFVVQIPGGKAVSFCGTLEGVSLMLLLDAVKSASAVNPWFPDSIRDTLARVNNGVSIKVLLENDCSLCRPVAEIAVGLGVMSRLINTEIIVADEYPDMLAKHKIKILPYTIFGTNLHLEGHASESEFLEKIFQAEGQRASGLNVNCAVCGRLSPDIICQGCKTKIQAEAVDHKRKEERSMEKGMGSDAGSHAH